MDLHLRLSKTDSPHPAFIPLCHNPLSLSEPLPSFPQEHSVRDLVGSGPFTVFAPLSTAFDEEPRVSMKHRHKACAGRRGLGLERSLRVSSWNQQWRHCWAGGLGSAAAMEGAAS